MARPKAFFHSACILFFAGSAMVASAAPAVPTLSSPSENAKNQTTSPTLSWNAVSDATSYHLQVSISPDFSSTIYDQNGIVGTSQAVGSGLDASIINIGTPVNYDNQGGRFGDNQRTMIRKPDGSFRSFDGAGHYLYEGTITNPLQNQPGNFSWSWNGDNTHEMSWIMAACNPGGDTLLGYVHTEDNGQELYTVGLALSTDFGSGWTYIGDVARHDVGSNLGGGMMIMMDGYFYMYYNGGGISVCRSLIDSVMIAARQKTVTPWMTYSNGDWTLPALTSSGTRTFPGDAHGGATVVKSTGTVLGLPNSGINTATTPLYASVDGLTTYQKFEIQAPGSVYGSFAGTAASGTRADHFEVGDSFYVYWDHKEGGSYNDDHFYYASVAVYPKKYYWRVRARDGSGDGEWSAARVFTTRATIQSEDVVHAEVALERPDGFRGPAARMRHVGGDIWILTYTHPGGCRAKIAVHDLHGRTVLTYLDANVNPGVHTTELSIHSLSAGQYLFSVRTGGIASLVPFAHH